MNYDETLKYIHSLGKFTYEAGLQRIKRVCEVLGNPQNEFKSIHIAGTNGKGSTAVLCAEMLKNAGYKTGLFISPYVVNFRERIQINGEYILENDLCFYTEKVKDTGVLLNEFEFITAVAFLYFKEKKIDVGVIEVGLGGRLDATNVLCNKAVSVIAKIGLDHTGILGDTVEKIAEEKCGIIGNEPVVTIPNQDKNALSVIKKHTEKLIIPNMPEAVKFGMNGTEFNYNGKQYGLSLLGNHQCLNAVTAMETVKAGGFDVSDRDIIKSFKTAAFAGRLEKVNETPPVYLDGAHNPDGGKVLADVFKNMCGEFTAVVGMMRDKNAEEFLKLTLEYPKRIIFTEIENPRCESAENLARRSGIYKEKSYVVPNLDKAIEKAFGYKNPVFIFGSLYIVSEARKRFKK